MRRAWVGQAEVGRPRWAGRGGQAEVGRARWAGRGGQAGRLRGLPTPGWVILHLIFRNKYVGESQTMTNNLENETMYCSEPEYDSDSEHSQWEEASDDEFGIHDGEAANLDYESRTVLPETPLNHWYKPTMRVFRPVQLAAMTSDYETLEEARNAMWIKMMQDEEDAREERLKAFEEEMVQNEINLAVHYKFMATLPTESEDGKIKRLAKEKLEAVERAKAKLKKFKEGKKALPFGHRRNGGGKHSHHEPATKEVIAARRSAARSLAKRTRRQEEEARQAKFEQEGVKAVEHKEYLSIPKSTKIKTDDDVQAEREEMAVVRAKTIEVVANFEDVVIKSTKEKKIKTNDDDSWTKVKKKKTIEPMVLKMGAAPYKPERKPFLSRQPVSSASPAPASPAQLERTRMCRSVETGKPCPHGAKCRYAHTTDQLNVVPCGFGARCRLVCCSKDKYFNTRNVSRMCQYIHPEETKVDYFHRVGIKIKKEETPKAETPKEKPPPPPPTPAPSPVKSAWSKPLVKVENKVENDKVENNKVEPGVEPGWTQATPSKRTSSKTSPSKSSQSSVSNSSSTSKRLCRSVETGKPCPHGAKCRFSHTPIASPPETVITVPAHMAIQALEMAMANGMTNVRIEIS